MTTAEFNETAEEILKDVRSEKRRWAAIVGALCLMAIVLISMAVIIFVDMKAENAREDAIDETLAGITGLCEDGAIDCEGYRGLPGPRAKPRGTIQDIDCKKGRFVFEFTHGRKIRVGDCRAERGPRGFPGSSAGAGSPAAPARPSPPAGQPQNQGGGNGGGKADPPGNQGGGNPPSHSAGNGNPPAHSNAGGNGGGHGPGGKKNKGKHRGH